MTKSNPHNTMSSASTTLLSNSVRDLRTACAPPLERKPAKAGAIHKAKYKVKGTRSWTSRS